MAIPIYVKPTSETIPAGAIYAAPNGLPSNAGTETNPKSLASAIAAAPAGGTVVLLGGKYRSSRITFGKALNIVAKPGSAPIISGGQVIPSSQFTLESASNTYVKSDYAISFDPPDPIQAASSDRQVVLNLQQVFLDGQPLYQAATKSAMVTGQFYIEPGTPGKLYLKDNPTGKIVEVSAERKGIELGSTASGTRIIGIGIEKYAYNIVTQGTSNLTIKEVTSFFSGFNGMRFEGGNNIKILDSDIAYAGCAGVMPRIVKNYEHRGGKLFGNNFADFAKNYSAAGLKALGSGAYPLPDLGINVITGVEVYDNKSNGIWLDINCQNWRVYGNKVHHNIGTGIFHEVSLKNYIVGNLVYRNNAGIYVSGSNGAEVWNNVLVNNNFNLLIKEIGRRNDKPDQVAAGITWQCKNTVVANNLFDSSTATGTESALYHMESNTSTTFETLMAVSKNNAYYRAAANTPQSVYKVKASGSQNFYDTVAQFRAAKPSYEAGSIAYAPAAVHPFFEAGTMTVKTGSPTIGAGAAVTGVVAELLGVPSGTVVSIGNDLTSDTPDQPPADACEARIQEAVATLEANLAELTDNLVSANNTIAAKNAVIAARDTTISGLQGTITSRDSEIVVLNDEIEDLESEVASLTAQLATANTNVSTLTSEIATLQARVTELEGQLGQSADAVEKLAAVKAQLQSTVNYIG